MEAQGQPYPICSQFSLGSDRPHPLPLLQVGEGESWEGIIVVQDPLRATEHCLATITGHPNIA